MSRRTHLFPAAVHVNVRSWPDQSGIEKRGHGATASLLVRDITIHTSFLPHDDPDASLAFYRDVLGFEVRSDVGQGRMRWITVGPAGQWSDQRTPIPLASTAAGTALTGTTSSSASSTGR